MATNREEWTVEQLNAVLESGAPFFLLDVRNRDDFEAGPIEGRRPLPTRNIPYFEMLDAGRGADLVESFVEYIRAQKLPEFPAGCRVLTVCARGETSVFVAQALRQLGYDASNLVGGASAWGDFYTVKPAIRSDDLTVFQVQRPARGCLSHVIVSGGRAAVVDPLRHIEHYTALAQEQGFTIDLVLDTHGHADHISGGPALAKRLRVPYYLHPFDGVHPIDVLPARIPFEFLRDGTERTIGKACLRFFHIPGHTLGNGAFLLDENVLFTGDSVFLRSIARPDLGGRAEAWAPLHYRSLQRLLELPDALIVMPAHFSVRDEADADGVFQARLGALRTSNAGLAMAQRSEAEFIEYILGSLPAFPDAYTDIKRVNVGLSQPDEERASELELGKNICALSQAQPAHR